MKRKNIRVFKLTHTYLEDEAIYIRSELSEMNLTKLIKVMQRKAVDIEETFDLSPSEMCDVLLQYEGIRAYPNEEDIKELESNGKYVFDFIEIDLYRVWEASNIIVLDEEVYDSKYNNEYALEIIKNYINEELWGKA
ncbi:hypothetical protein ACY1J9_001411 [Clostridium botulinum]